MNDYRKAYVFYQNNYWVVDGVRLVSELGFCLQVTSLNEQQENLIPIIRHNFFTEMELIKSLLSKPRLVQASFSCPSGDQPSLLIE